MTGKVLLPTPDEPSMTTAKRAFRRGLATPLNAVCAVRRNCEQQWTSCRDFQGQVGVDRFEQASSLFCHIVVGGIFGLGGTQGMTKTVRRNFS